MTSHVYRTVCKALLGAFATCLQARFADAQIVADPLAPRLQQPTVLQAGNGVPLVNIQTPSAAGVSRNTYRQFDVPASGVVLNNSRTNVQTVLGGWVQGNPWLAGGPARVIVNEVNAIHASQLRGTLEVAGQRAQVVIANPSGIACEGCGFIHADRLTLTTGTPLFNAGNLDGYRVLGGTVTVSGNGLDAKQVDHAQVLARAMEVNAGIWADALTVRTGTGSMAVDPEGAVVEDADRTSAAAPGPGPAFALDVGAIGGMYAGKIFLVGSEAGLGVRNAGHLGAQAGQLVLTVDGRIENSGHISASGDVTVKGAQVDNHGSILADGALALTSTAGLDNGGTLYGTRAAGVAAVLRIDNGGLIGSLGSVSVSATGAGAEVRSAWKSVIAAGLSEQGDHWAVAPSAVADVTIGASLVGLHGKVLASGAIDVSAPHVNVSGGELIASSIRLDATSGDLDASRAHVASTGSLSLAAAQTVRTEAATVSAARVTIRGEALSNIGGDLLAGGRLDVTVRDLRNAAGRLTAVGEASLAASLFDNANGSVEAGDLTVRAGRVASAGLLLAHGRADVEASGVLVNAGTIAADGDLRLAAGTIDNVRGVVVAGGDQS
ncbi:MAG: putative hemagglutinin-related protein, partial [Rhizobacter sp.]|nr:putative hemagglutinin-related protein [Rhizobacter sp.]